MVEKVKSLNITNGDWLRFIEVILNDEVKTLCRSSQDFLNCIGLNSYNSVLHVINFYDTLSEVFNDKNFDPEADLILDLHPVFAVTKKLVIGEYMMIRQIAKDIIMTVRPVLATMITKYELNGNGAGQRLEENEDFGRVDSSLCMDGDDR